MILLTHDEGPWISLALTLNDKYFSKTNKMKASLVLKLTLFHLLLTISKSEDVEKVDVKISEIIKQKCRIGKGIQAPNEYRNSTFNLELEFRGFRLSEINDIEESFSMLGTLMVAWDNQCIRELEAQKDIPWPDFDGKQYPITMDADDIWVPDVNHFNSMNQETFQSGRFTRRIGLSKEGLFTIYIFGKFDSTCDLQFWSFPFDEQTCAINFEFFSGWQYFRVTRLNVTTNENFMPPNSNWILANYTHEVDPFPSIVIEFNFQRKSRYFTVNLFCPGFILILLQLSAFFIPPNGPDRTAFMATVMLAMFLLHSQVISYLPKTSVPIMTSYYILGEIFFAMICTIYSSILSFLMKNRANTMKTTVSSRFGSCKLVALIDIIAFTFASSILLLFNLIFARLANLL